LAIGVELRDGRSGLGLLAPATGMVTVVSTTDSARRVAGAVFSQVTDELVFDAPQRKDESSRDIFAVRLDGQSERRLIADPSNDYIVGLSPDGRSLIFLSDRNGAPGIWTVPLNASAPPRILVADLGRISPLGITKQGVLYYKSQISFVEAYTATLDLAARSIVGELRSHGSGGFPSWSPDGRILAFQVFNAKQPTLAFWTPETDITRQVPLRLNYLGRPQWRTRDSLIGFGIGQGPDGYVEIASQTGEIKSFVDSASIETSFEGAWSSDGNVWFNRFQQNRRGLFRYDARTKQRDVILVPGPDQDMGQENLALSPDGQTLAFQLRSKPSLDTRSLMVLPTAGGGPRTLWSVRAPEAFLYGAFTWLPDSKTLLVARSRNDNNTSELWLVPVNGSTPQQISFPAVPIRNLRMSPDGRSIAFHSTEKELAELRVLENFLPRQLRSSEPSRTPSVRPEKIAPSSASIR